MDAPLLVASAYLIALAGGFAAVAVWETIAPARVARAPISRRWPANLALMALNQGVLPLVLPVTNVGAAWIASRHGWGLLHAVEAPAVVAFVTTLLAMDLARYASHRVLHTAPLFWRIHRVHHSDPDYDASLALRFHPLEAVVTAIALSGVVIALGAPVGAVIASDLATIVLGYFAHGNLRVAPRVDRALRRVIVTPALHATHHSVEADEALSNFGSILSIWDRMAGTLRERARAGEAIAFGLAEERDPGRLGFVRLMAMPFRVESR